MAQSSGLLVIDLQYGFAPNPDLVERIRDTAQDYSVIVATKFVNPLLNTHCRRWPFAGVRMVPSG